MSWHPKQCDLWGFIAMIVCITTLIVTLLLGGTQFVTRVYAWVCGRPRPETNGRLALESQWSLGRATLETLWGDAPPDWAKARLRKLELLMTQPPHRPWWEGPCPWRYSFCSRFLWLLLISRTAASGSAWFSSHFSQPRPPLAFSGLWGFFAMIVCVVTLFATILLAGCHTGGFISRSFAWLRGRPAPKSSQRLALESQWSMERAALTRWGTK